MWPLLAAWTPSLYRRVCAVMLFKTSCSADMMTVSCSVLRHCLMMMPNSCVVFLQKAAGFLLGARGNDRVPVYLCFGFLARLRLNHVLQPPTCDESACVSSPLLRWEHHSEAGVPSSTAGMMRRCSNRQTYRRWLGQVDCTGMII